MIQRRYVLLVLITNLWLPIISTTLAGQLPQQPNILLAISDDQSYPHASAYGCRSVSTPAFDRVASEGVLFRNAICSSPGCSPSRASLLTGRYPWQLEHAGTHGSSFSAKYRVYPDILEDSGYFVGYTGKGWGPGNWEDGGRRRNPAGMEFNDQKLEDIPTDGIKRCNYAGNFQEFLAQRTADQPFCFWYGGHEPHRVFEQGSGAQAGLNAESVEVPEFLPDTPEIREDLLDYFREIQHFDEHLGRMLKLLEDAGELDNTLVVVTSDNGMAFPRAKANGYEYGIHVPLAIRWPQRISGGREIDELVSFVDLARTFLDAAGCDREEAMVGKSLVNILANEQARRLDPQRTAVYSARERHSSSRYNNLAYPQRMLRTVGYLYIRNFRPERWPAGAPQKYDGPGKLGPMHGGYHDIDACPTLTFLIERRSDPQLGRYFHLAVDKRPAEELFDIREDPACLNNLIGDAQHEATHRQLKGQLEAFLRETGDPRILDGGEIFETYKRYANIRQFPPPE